METWKYKFVLQNLRPDRKAEGPILPKPIRNGGVKTENIIWHYDMFN